MKKSLTLFLLFVLFAVVAFASLSTTKKRNAQPHNTEKKAEKPKGSCRHSCLFS